MNVSPIIKYRTLAIAKALAPVDTGNLRHNAIYLTKVKNDRWTIRYNTRQANYIEPLEEGWTDKRTGKTYNKHKRFIEGTSKALAVYLKKHFQGKPLSSWYQQNLRRALSTAQDNPERRLRNIESRIRYKREVDNK